MNKLLLFMLMIITSVHALGQEASVRGSFARPFEWTNEMYSETLYSTALERAAMQTRLRHENNLGLLPHTIFAFAGVVLEREFAGDQRSLFIENSSSPAIGLLARPAPGLTIWGEYRRRFREATKLREAASQDDPRFGLAFGRLILAPSNPLNAELYFEIHGVPRIVALPTASGHIRFFARKAAGQFGNFDLYSELNEFFSAHRDLGSSRHQVRAGGRWAHSWGAWSTSVFIYKPWTIEEGQVLARDLEALFVLGGQL